MDPTPNTALLKELQADMRGRWFDVYKDTPRENLQLRVYRAARWVEQAEKAASDDTAFIFYWIAFNAAYAEGRSSRSQRQQEQQRFRWYFCAIVNLDEDRAIQCTIKQELSNKVMDILGNQYLFQPFWNHVHHGEQKDKDWKREFEKDQEEVQDALDAITNRKGKNIGKESLEQSTVTILSKVFTRLYVFRNQLMHGGATPGGRLNRKQVEDGKAIMAYLLPQFISLMWTNIDLIAATADEWWGRPPYPPVP